MVTDNHLLDLMGLNILKVNKKEVNSHFLVMLDIVGVYHMLAMHKLISKQVIIIR